METAAIIVLPAMFLLLALGYSVMGRVTEKFNSRRTNWRSDRSLQLAERSMVQVAMARTELARRNADLKALADKLDLSGAELARLNDMKSKFLSMVVHDVRSPLATIKGYSQLLVRKMPGDREREQFNNIVSAADQLNRLIADLTDLAMIEAGKLTMSPEPFDLRLIAGDILPGMRIKGAEKNVEVAHIEPADPVMLSGDRFRLAQVLMNLLNNAIKFTPSGGTVTLTIAAEGRRGCVYVKDSGIGLHPSEVKKVFEKFYQAKYQTDAALRKQGWGLGLSISTEIVKAHGGDIAATSAGLGKGSTFYYKVPLL